jgi:hypothetical protein
MRVVADIPHPACKITIFYWNSKYLIKLERDMLEQTFKVPEWDVAGEDDVRKLLSDEFLQEAVQRFSNMNLSLNKALECI